MNPKEASKFLGGFFGGITVAHYFLMQSQLLPFTYIDFPVTIEFFYTTWAISFGVAILFIYLGWFASKAKKK